MKRLYYILTALIISAYSVFGYTILEALCAGTQVIASDLLGASMLVSSEMIYDGRVSFPVQLAGCGKPGGA